MSVFDHLFAEAHATTEVITGSALIGLNAVSWVYYVNLVASTIAAICGAIIGIHGVIRLIRSHRRYK